MNDGKMNTMVTLAIAITLALSLSACGRKGPLEAPTGSVVETGDTKPADQGNRKKPDRPFILDGLI